MNVMVKKYLALGLALCVVSCSEKKIAEAPELQLVGVTDTGATALAFDSEGKLVDAVEIQPGADIEWIEFRAPQNGEEIYVEIVGPNQSEVLRSRKAVVSSKVAKGYLGAVIVEVKDGTVVGVRGNKITSGSKLSPGMLEEAKSILDDPQRNRPESTVIVQRNNTTP